MREAAFSSFHRLVWWFKTCAVRLEEQRKIGFTSAIQMSHYLHWRWLLFWFNTLDRCVSHAGVYDHSLYNKAHTDHCYLLMALGGKNTVLVVSSMTECLSFFCALIKMNGSCGTGGLLKSFSTQNDHVRNSLWEKKNCISIISEFVWMLHRSSYDSGEAWSGVTP